MTPKRVAAIDCGTNSIRLLVAEVQVDGTLRDIDRTMTIVRLGHGVDRTGELAPEAIERTLAATREYAEVIEQSGVERVRFAATSASRDARNRQVFVDGVQRILGVEPEVISGSEEAALSYAGVVASLPDPGPVPRLVVDIGGGSTELLFGTDRPEADISLDMGSVRITERYLQTDPPTAAEVASAVQDIDGLLDRAAESIDFSRVRSVVGVAGTVTTMTALALGLESYVPERTHGARIGVREMQVLCKNILDEPRSTRARRPAIHPGRIDVIGAGALIYSRVLTRAGVGEPLERVTTSEHDILDGLALSIA